MKVTTIKCEDFPVDNNFWKGSDSTAPTWCWLCFKYNLFWLWNHQYLPNLAAVCTTRATIKILALRWTPSLKLLPHLEVWLHKVKYLSSIGNPCCPWIGPELSRCSNENERSGHIDGRGGIRFPLLTAADIALYWCVNWFLRGFQLSELKEPRRFTPPPICIL